MSQKWKCLVCGHDSYQRYKIVAEGKKINEDSEEKTIFKLSQFYCKGCSVVFQNPYLFNRLRE